MRLKILQLNVTLQAQGMGIALTPPVNGSIPADPRLEVVKCDTRISDFSKQLIPHWSEYCVRVKPEFINTLQSEYRSKTIMVFGESSVLVLVIFISSFMLYRLIWLERRADQELHELWGRITHEIKTPITGLKAFLQTLSKQDLSREEMQPLIEMAMKQIERQEQLAGNLLIGRRLEIGGSGLTIDSLNAPDIMKKIIEPYRLNLPQNAIQFEFETPDISIMADIDAFRVIVENLLDNAVKYVGRELTLIITVKTDRKNVLIAFSDNGPGFESQMASNLFKAFRRFSHELPGKRHGSGMGLHIARKLALKMNGELVAASDGPGHGATFTLILPQSESRNIPDKGGRSI